MGGVPADLASPTAPSVSRGSALRRELARIAAPVLWPTAASMRGLSLAMVIANAGSIVTGAAVRLSQSGLGCPTWPECTRQSLVASASTDSSLVHAWIEFGNRLFVTLIMIVAVLVFVAAWRYRRGPRQPEGAPRPGPALTWLAAVQPAGVVLQAVMGGIVVLTKLDPATVSIHFLASIAVLGAAVALHAWFADPVLPPGAVIRADLRWLSAGLAGVTALMLAAGTVVTGTGPLAGAASVPRYQLPLAGATQFHADIGWLLGGLAVATAIALRYASPPPGAARRAWLLFGLILTQGVIGYAQYFSGLPAGLVWVHVLGATLIWIAALRLFFVLHPVFPRLHVRPAAELSDTHAVIDRKW
jgi:cytochrome c oxidase assembly protein subunit 15